MKTLNRRIVSILFGLIFFGLISSAQESNAQGEWDGRYNASFAFKMGSSSVCPKQLPVEIELRIKNNQVEGYIFNNGGGNSHNFCKLYHNGKISGKVADDGGVKLKVSQKDSHAREYSSYRIKGNLDGELKLLSWNSTYHPTHKFTLKRFNEDVASKKSEVKEPEEVLNTPKPTEVKTSKTDSLQGQKSPVPSIQKSDTSGKKNSISASKKIESINSSDEAKRYINEVQATITMYMSIKNVLLEQPISLKDRVLSVVDFEIGRLREEKNQLQDILSKRFSTPIRPENSNLGVSAFRASDTFPKIPYYVPGTSEIGEMLVIPRVSDVGLLTYQFDFIDPVSTYDKVRDRIDVKHSDIDTLIDGLQKIDMWTTVSQENQINRRIEKSSACIPEGVCENKKVGISSTEVVFQVYEDGSTAGRIQRNKGKYSSGYNMSVESSVLLSAYLLYMKDVGSREFNVGVMSDDEVKDLFQ